MINFFKDKCVILSNDERVHGIDYTKGLKDGETCGKMHKYVTNNCRVLVFSSENKDGYYLFSLERCISINSLNNFDYNEVLWNYITWEDFKEESYLRHEEIIKERTLYYFNNIVPAGWKIQTLKKDNNDNN